MLLAACGSTQTGGTGGTGGQGTGGSSATGGTTGTGGSNSSGGTTGTGGSSTGGGTGTGGAATGGSVGAGGMSGAGGHGPGGSGAAGSVGTGGSAGGSTGFVPYTCPTGMSAPTSVPAGSGATRITGAPPSDAFNNSGNDFTNVEGPVWIGNALYFSEMLGNPNPPPARILKIDSSDTVSMFYPASGAGGDSGSNGLAVDRQGHLLSANHAVGGIVAFDVSTQTKISPPVISSYNGKRFDSPNDLTVRSDGTIYFTDPSFQAPSPAPQSVTGVYMVPPGSSTATQILSSLSNPNGVALSLDEHTLYVGHGGGVYSYPVNSDGTIGMTATHVDASTLDNNATDGMAVDCAGDLYVVRVNQKDIDVVSFGSNPGGAGTHLGSITNVPGNGQLTNIAFGGSDHKTLYITAQGSGTQRGVFKLAMPIAGMP
ncbi:MAG TPA: SMP-30/gluconolactonase/LRE family protein, partial [Polyangia bacterium]|nr:SMP-30/gluconolactonase/LRE family protein [Polyangia bacterium]